MGVRDGDQKSSLPRAPLYFSKSLTGEYPTGEYPTGEYPTGEYLDTRKRFWLNCVRTNYF